LKYSKNNATRDGNSVMTQVGVGCAFFFLNNSMARSQIFWLYYCYHISKHCSDNVFL